MTKCYAIHLSAENRNSAVDKESLSSAISCNAINKLNRYRNKRLTSRSVARCASNQITLGCIMHLRTINEVRGSIKFGAMSIERNDNNNTIMLKILSFNKWV